MNTTMQAKSTFSEGLIMDFSPDNTQSSTLTSALNATLLTFNGNELALQNDMGNGRVETAYLPEGYIPVGTCEFGDIIYIVSYNPIKNKSLIGCFPSPERNISNSEIGGTKLIIKASDFLELNENGEPTGKLKATSCKKILFLKDLNPGDKYLISASNLEMNGDRITDYGNTSHQYGEYVKLFKIHVVSIEDSGKINYLDSSVKWYDNNYFIADNEGGLEVPDIDSFRSKINSGYSIFQSKISGKLALLIELEKINSFSCTYLIYTKDTSVVSLLESLIENKNFEVYWFINWESDNPNISPSNIVLTKSQWSGKNKNNAGKVFYYTKNLDGLYVIDYDNGGEYLDSLILPVSYNNNDYWYKKITTCVGYLLITDYNSFLLYNYNELCSRRLKEISTELYGNSDYPLYKINLLITHKGIPMMGENTYYVNVNYYDNGKYYTTDNNGKYIEISPKTLVDDIVNNYFKGLVCKKFSTFSIPYSQIIDGHTFKPDISNLIYNYAITPAMSYGLLEEFTLEGFIDFSKVGSGEINLTNWKYYNTENISTLTIGLDVYPEPNKGVSEVTIDFYDNLGIAATYRISNKSSYSGQFTEYIPLNNSTSNYKLSDLDSNNNKIYHAGIVANLETENIVFKTKEGKVYPIYKKDNEFYYKTSTLSIKIDPSRDLNNIYTNDAGTIYSNIVYLTRITVKYGPKNAIGEYHNNMEDYRYFDRWYWTNNMFNEHYYNVQDFELLLPVLNLDVGASYNSNKYWLIEEKTYESSSPDNNLSSIVLAINLNGDYDTSGNIDNNIIIGLQDTYNTFAINKDHLDDFLMRIFLGKTYIKNSKDPIEVKYTNYLINNINDYIMPNNYIPSVVNNNNEVYNGKMSLSEMSPTLSQLLNCGNGTGSELWENPDLYKNRFSINFSDNSFGSISESSISYINQDLEYIDLDHVLCISIDGITEESLTKNPLVFSGIHFSKYYKEFTIERKKCDVYTPILNSTSDLDKYGLLIINNHLYFKELVTIGGSRSETHGYILSTLHKINGDGVYTPDYSDEDCFKVQTPDGNVGLISDTKAHYKVWLLDDEGKKFADLFNYNIVPVLISTCLDNTKIYTTLNFVYDNKYTSTSLFINDTIYPDIFLPYYIMVGTNSSDPSLNTRKSAPLSYKFDIPSKYADRRLAIMGLAMKDQKGQIHVLNSFVPVIDQNSSTTPREGYTAYNITLYIKWIRGPWDVTIGDIVGSILSNIYIKLPSTQEVDISKESNIVYLENHSTLFTQDIIYDVHARETIPLLLTILILNYNLLSYILKVKSTLLNTTVSDNNVLPTIQQIVKNIPILINFDYRIPLTTLDLSEISAVVRKSTGSKLMLINNVYGVGPLYSLEETNGQRNIVLAININCGTINNIVNDAKSGYLISKYNNLQILKNNEINLLFTYDNGLVLKRDSLPSLELMGFMTDLLKQAVCGVSRTEYLTESLKSL